MVRTYAVIMTLVAMNVVLLRAIKNGAGLQGTVASALLWMLILGAVGMVVGMIAKSTVDQSVLAKIEGELAAIQDNSTEPTASPAEST